MDTPFAIASLAIIIAIILMRIFKFNDIEKRCLFFAAIFFIIGIVADIYAGINPLENLIVPFLAELAMVFLGVIIAFRLVDTYKDKIKKQEWSEVRGPHCQFDGQSSAHHLMKSAKSSMRGPDPSSRAFNRFSKLGIVKPSQLDH